MKISPGEKLLELRETLGHIEDFIARIQSGKFSYGKPLAVELRKLYSQGGATIYYEESQKIYLLNSYIP